MNKVEKGLVAAGKGVLKVVESPALLAEDLARGIRVLDSAIAAEPEVKTVLTELVRQSTAIGTEVGADITERGLNIVTDVATIQSIDTLAKYVQSTVVPLLVKLGGEVKADVKV